MRVNAGGAMPRSGPMAGLMSALSGFLEAVEELTMGADDGVVSHGILRHGRGPHREDEEVAAAQHHG